LKRLISEAGNPELLSKTGQKKHQAYLDELKDFERKREELLKIQNSNERPYFLWHLFFLDVFEKGGFDVIIGNPPYIQLQKMGKDADILQGSGFETFERTGDIYCLFYEKGFDLLKNDRGILSYITSNSWMKTKYGEALRKYFINYTNPIELLNFEDTLIFPSATVEVNILISKKAKNKGVLEVVVFDKTFNTSVSIYDFYQKNSYTITHFDDNGWVISDKESMNLKSEIEKNTKPLSEFNIQMFIGLLIGLNEAFIVDAETKDEFIKIDPKNRDILKPLLRGRDVQKFAYNFENNWLIFAHNGVKKLNIERINVIDDYPIIFNHLKNYEEKLIIRHNQGDHWTNMRNCAYLKEFEKPKIIWGEISDKPKFCFDDKGIYMNDRCSFMVGENLKFILVLLNSKLIEWYFNLISTSSGMGTNMWKHYKIKLLPIPKNINYDTFYKIEIISEYLIILNDRNTSQILEHSTNEIISHNIEEISNMIVFELYFEEHMKEKEIDVLQFVDFPDISKMQSFEEKRDTIQKIYYWLKEKDNPIRNRILVSESRSWIIKRINQSTH
jgi:hypothetical protein